MLNLDLAGIAEVFNKNGSISESKKGIDRGRFDLSCGGDPWAFKVRGGANSKEKFISFVLRAWIFRSNVA